MREAKRHAIKPDRQTERQIDRQTERLSHSRSAIQTNKHTHANARTLSVR